MPSPSKPRARRPRDSAATKQLLLEAATDEFSEHGLAGARIDRIAERAGVNKRLLYVYFGDKDRLFDIVVEQWGEAIVRAIPLDIDDLCALAAARFDYFLARPESLRLANWRIIDRVEPTKAERDAFKARVAQVATAQRDGKVRSDIPAIDLFAIVLRITESWLSAPPALKAAAGKNPMSKNRLRQHRAALIEAVRSITAPR
jgi:AcrR family transcriptional regulator